MRSENPREPDREADEREGEGHEGHPASQPKNRITISDVERPEEEEDRAAGNCREDTITWLGLEVTLPGHLKVQPLMLRPVSTA